MPDDSRLKTPVDHDLEFALDARCEICDYAIRLGLWFQRSETLITRPIIFAVVLTAIAFDHSTLWAQQESRSWLPKMFSADEDKNNTNPTSRTASNAAKSSSDSAWLLPWKSANKPAKSSKSNGSVMSRMGRTTKKWWDNSLDFVNPFNDAPKPKPPNGYMPQNNTKKTGGGIFGWGTPQEEQRIDSINEFLKLPMPE